MYQISSLKSNKIPIHFFVNWQLSTLELVVLVKLELWDTGERALNWFDHILPACQSATDGTLFFFSYEDRYNGV